MIKIEQKTKLEKITTIAVSYPEPAEESYSDRIIGETPNGDIIQQDPSSELDIELERRHFLVNMLRKATSLEEFVKQILSSGARDLDKVIALRKWFSNILPVGPKSISCDVLEECLRQIFSLENSVSQETAARVFGLLLKKIGVEDAFYFVSSPKSVHVVARVKCDGALIWSLQDVENNSHFAMSHPSKEGDCADFFEGLKQHAGYLW